jgi:hypothetical protein
LNKFIRAADQRLDDYLRRLDEGDVEEGGTGGGVPTKNLAETIAVQREKRGHYEVMSAELERTGEAQISLTKTIVEQAMGGPNGHTVHMFRSDAASRCRRGNIAYIFVWK